MGSRAVEISSTVGQSGGFVRSASFSRLYGFEAGINGLDYLLRSMGAFLFPVRVAEKDLRFGFAEGIRAWFGFCRPCRFWRERLYRGMWSMGTRVESRCYAPS